MKDTQGAATIVNLSKEHSGLAMAPEGKVEESPKAFKSKTADFIAIGPLALFQQT